MGGTAQDKEVPNGIHSNYQGQHRCRARLLRHVRQTGPCEKEWLKRRFDEGLIFYRSVERGKMLHRICPRGERVGSYQADGYLYIDCLWVADSMKGHGYSNDLLRGVRAGCEGAGAEGLCILSAEGRKRELLSDAKYLAHKGFHGCGHVIMRNHAHVPAVRFRTRSLRNSKNAPNIPRRMVMDSFSTTRTSVRSPTTGCHAWKRWRKSTTFH